LPLFYPKAKTTSLVVALATITESPSVTASENLIPFGPMSDVAIPSFTPAPNPAPLTYPNFSPLAYATFELSSWMNPPMRRSIYFNPTVRPCRVRPILLTFLKRSAPATSSASSPANESTPSQSRLFHRSCKDLPSSQTPPRLG